MPCTAVSNINPSHDLSACLCVTWANSLNVSEYRFLMVAIEKTPLFSAIEVALNRVLAQQESVLAQCAELYGQNIGLKFTDFNRTLVFAPHAKGITVLAPPQLSEDAEINATIETTLVALGRAAVQKDQAGLPDGMRLTGDTEVARQFSEILQQLDIDWEEHVAKQFGDVVAHQLGEGVRSLFSWGKSVADSLSRDAAEFVREEAQQTPHPDEVAEFVDEVDELRSATDRLEARINLLLSAAE